MATLEAVLFGDGSWVSSHFFLSFWKTGPKQTNTHDYTLPPSPFMNIATSASGVLCCCGGEMLKGSGIFAQIRIRDETCVRNEIAKKENMDGRKTFSSKLFSEFLRWKGWKKLECKFRTRGETLKRLATPICMRDESECCRVLWEDGATERRADIAACRL